MITDEDRDKLDQIAEDRPTPPRHSAHREVYYEEFGKSSPKDRLTIKMFGDVDEKGEDFAFRSYEYWTETEGWYLGKKAYVWEGGYSCNDLADALKDLMKTDCPFAIAEKQEQIWREVKGAKS